MLFTTMLKEVEGKKNAPVTITLKGGAKSIYGEVLKVDNGMVTLQNHPPDTRKHFVDLTEIAMVSQP